MDHPTREQLLNLLEGQAEEYVAAHVDQCEPCQAILSALSNEELPTSSDLQNATREESFQESEFASLLSEERTVYHHLSDPVQFVDGRYKLLIELNRGGFGTIHRADDKRLNREVVVKLLHRQHWTPEVLKRFQREAIAIAQLEHENVIRVHDLGDCSQHGPYLVTELLAGCDLKDVGRVTIPEACELVRQAASGLAFAHQHGQVHRDIKPGNLFLTTGGVVKVLDFGLVKLRAIAQEEGLTSTDQGFGTPAYMSKEQWEAAGKVDLRADIYSLGCTLWYLLTNQNPPGYPEPFPPLRQYRPEVSEELARIFERMTAMEETGRYDSCELVVQALTPFAEGVNLKPLAGASESGARPIVSDLNVLLVGSTVTSIFDKGVLPVRKGARIRIEAWLSEPMHLYLIWISSEGNAVPLYPWEPGDWDNSQAQERRDRLLLPGEGLSWDIDTEAGVETVLMLGHREGLEPSTLRRLREMMKHVPWLRSLPNAKYPCVTRSERAEQSLAGTRLGVMPKRDEGTQQDPISAFREDLQRRLENDCDLIHALSFANCGEEGGPR